MFNKSKGVIKLERKKQSRTRNFATVVYPESAPDNWISTLEDSHVSSCISPLHDKDVSPDGEIKKAHYHVIIMFDSVKTSEQAQEIFDSIGGVGCEMVKSCRGYMRYLCHLDNPEKHRYNVNEVISLNGADFVELCTLPSDKYIVIGQMMQYICDNAVTSYRDFMLFCRDNQEDWFRLLCDNSSYIILEFIKANNWALKEAERSGV